MATKSVGVRELKEQAPKLVERAAAGERIVITRYGKPVAALGPAGDEATAEGRPRLRAWERERKRFDEMLPALLDKHRGEYVAISGGKLVATGADAEVAYRRARRRVKDATIFVGRVGEPPPVVDMPGFSIE